jgi:hypothetical protein
MSVPTYLQYLNLSQDGTNFSQLYANALDSNNLTINSTTGSVVVDAANLYYTNSSAAKTLLNTTLDGVQTSLAGKQATLTFDSVPTDASTNPVESNGVFDALALKQDLITIDAVPTDASTNAVQSDGVFDALALKQDVITVDSVPTDASTNPVQSDGVFDALVLKADATVTDGQETRLAAVEAFLTLISSATPGV